MGGQSRTRASERKRIATCNAILEATSLLIAEKGVAGFTLSEVAARGKINRSLIYHYYRDRENLIFEAIRFVVNRFDQIRLTRGNDDVEQNIRLHIEHPEIGRFIFNLMLTGRPLPNLSRRITDAIAELERLKGVASIPSTVDPTFAVISGWLVQLAWSCAREEIARLLDLSPEEADRRFIANTRATRSLFGRLPAADR